MSDFKDVAHKTVAELFDMLKEKVAEVDSLKTQLNNMETCYIEVKKERDELLSRVTKAQGCFQDFYSTGYHVHIFEADEALRGAND